ncbi:MAG: LytTR family DNA-binding domain-containing protein [Reichenbachiella sp.]|uniref:LytR/AlgR family response regulator transcription factor n=1 Tax=Reichenbachiella sp. TaxID=2184521 RepID=UPI003266AB5D
MSLELSCIAIDDEPVALKIITSLIEKTETLELLGTFQNPEEGMNFVVQRQPDIVFLDVQMPGISGMDIIKSLTKKPQIILVTSNSKYATEAFDFQVTDFLLKPIKNYARFMQAVQVAMSNITKAPPSLASSEKLGIFLKIDSELINVAYDEILFIEAYGDYIKVHTRNRVHVVYCSLSSIEKKLPLIHFTRTHRSYIINTGHIQKIYKGDVLVAERKVPVSPRYKKDLFSNIDTL